MHFTVQPQICQLISFLSHKFSFSLPQWSFLSPQPPHSVQTNSLIIVKVATQGGGDTEAGLEQYVLFSAVSRPFKGTDVMWHGQERGSYAAANRPLTLKRGRVSSLRPAALTLPDHSDNRSIRHDGKKPVHFHSRPRRCAVRLRSYLFARLRRDQIFAGYHRADVAQQPMYTRKSEF